MSLTKETTYDYEITGIGKNIQQRRRDTILEDGVEWVRILIGDTDDWGMLQELNLERGITGDTFSTWTLAPYYVRLRNYEG